MEIDFFFYNLNNNNNNKNKLLINKNHILPLLKFPSEYINVRSEFIMRTRSELIWIIKYALVR